MSLIESSLLLLCSMAIGVAVSDSSVDLRLVTYNVQSFPRLIQSTLEKHDSLRALVKSVVTGSSSSPDRTDLIPDELIKAARQHFEGRDPDIICFQEAFSSRIYKAIKKFAKNNNYHMTGPIPRSLQNLQPINSGVIVLSKTPFDHVESVAFDRSMACGLDRFARKGFIYAETTKDQLKFGIIGTHLQAIDSSCQNQFGSAETVARKKQGEQLERIGAFLQGDRFGPGPSADAVFLMGDLNLNSFDSKTQSISWATVQHDLDRVQAQKLAAPTGLRASFDPKSNNYFERLRQAKTPAPEHDDYVLALDVPGAQAQVTVPNVIVPIRYQGSDDLSDHHAIVAHAVITKSIGKDDSD